MHLIIAIICKCGLLPKPKYPRTYLIEIIDGYIYKEEMPIQDPELFRKYIDDPNPDKAITVKYIETKLDMRQPYKNNNLPRWYSTNMERSNTYNYLPVEDMPAPPSDLPETLPIDIPTKIPKIRKSKVVVEDTSENRNIPLTKKEMSKWQKSVKEYQCQNNCTYKEAVNKLKKVKVVKTDIDIVEDNHN
jgi:hypothetical protein